MGNQTCFGTVSSLASKQSATFVRHRNTGARSAWVLSAGIALIPALSVSAPLVFEEVARIGSPDPTYSFPLQVAVEGDTLIATGVKFVREIEHNTAFLFRRQSNGTWAFVKILASTSCDSGEVGEDTCNAAVSIRNGVAIVSADQVYVFTRSSDGNWVAAPSNGFSGPGDAAVGTNTIFASESQPQGCVFASKAFKKNSAGVWSLVATMPGPAFPGCDSWGLNGSDIDVSAGNRLIVGTSSFTEEVQVYEPSSTSWNHTATLTSPVGEWGFGHAVAIDDRRAFVSGTSNPIHVYSRSTGAWTQATNIAPPDSAQYGSPSSIKARGLVVAGFAGDPHRSGSIGLFRESASGQYEQVARLVGSDAGARQLYLGADVDAFVDGSFARVAATSSSGHVYVFDLNNWGITLAPLREDFELSNSANWTPMAGSSFTVASSGGSKVYRQSDFAGDAGSFVTSIDWTNQAVEADVRPTAFNGPNSWVGLAVRRTDANNYYYITLRRTNVLELKRMVNGSFVTLASTPLSMVLNRNYRLRLEAIGTLLRAYVNGRLALQTRDTTLKHGHAGLRMWQTRADFDNVMLSQNPHLTLLDERIYRLLADRWSTALGTWSEALGPNDVQRLVQTDQSGDARAITLVPAHNQIVQARVTANSFATGTGVRWVGLLARYTNAGNFYYVTLRSDNTISLRKLVNGAIQVLDTAPFTASVGTSYSLRLEAIENSLRAYVNGTLLLEASDTTHTTGTYGAAMYKAAATYDDFIVWEP